MAELALVIAGVLARILPTCWLQNLHSRRAGSGCRVNVRRGRVNDRDMGRAANRRQSFELIPARLKSFGNGVGNTGVDLQRLGTFDVDARAQNCCCHSCKNLFRRCIPGDHSVWAPNTLTLI